MEIKVLDINVADYIPKNVLKYIPQSNEKEIVKTHLEHGKSIILEGPQGCGKTLLLGDIACEQGIPLIQFDCSENTKRSDLIGHFVLIGDEVYYQLGAFPTAFELANRHGKAILVLEEMNALSPNMQKVLNQVTDWRNHCYVPEIHKIYNLNQGCKLMVAATMNPSYYGGVFELNADLKSRFLILKLGYPAEEKEKEIVKSQVKVDAGLLQKLETLAIETRNALLNGSLSYAISPRDIIQTIEGYNIYPNAIKNEAIKLGLLNKFDEENERKLMQARIKAIMGIDL